MMRDDNWWGQTNAPIKYTTNSLLVNFSFIRVIKHPVNARDAVSGPFPFQEPA